MSKHEATAEFRRIVAVELPHVRIKFIKGVRVFASKADAALSRKLSARLSALHSIMEVCDER